jgi:hypothetical protein
MTALAETTPHGDDAARDARCPVCDYSLRGLAEPRCPECGWRVGSWDELYRRLAETHPFLYEHHPRRGAWALARTWRASQVPWRFWASVRPEHRINVRRLALYWLLGALLLIAPAALMLAQVGFATYASFERERGRYAQYLATRGDAEPIVRQIGSVEAAVAWIYPKPTSPRFYHLALRNGPATQLLVPVVLLTLAWPWLVVPAMYMFALTLRRARVRAAQVFRCAVYSWDVVALPALALVVASIGMLVAPIPAGVPVWSGPWQQWHRTVAAWLVPVTLTLAAVVALRLGVALARYLRLRHAMLTALLIQAVLGLLCAKLAYVMWGY